MKKLIIISLSLTLGLTACYPIATCDQVFYVEIKDSPEGKIVTQLDFTAGDGAQSIYVETTLPYWRVNFVGALDVHPKPGEVVLTNSGGWLTIKYTHRPLGLFNGFIEVSATANESGMTREDEIYIWNDDVPASHITFRIIKIVQEFE
jgi:hypothetical protein